MTGPSPAVAATRVAVRSALAALGGSSPTDLADPAPATADPASDGVLLVACSGGPDSLALAAAAAFEGPRAGRQVGAVVVDHGLQPGSTTVADRAADQCRSLGLEPVVVSRVTVPTSPSGPEAAARQARYAALTEVADRLGAAAVLLGHTLDDQAEQVLLGLARGSGARSLAGMPPVRGRFLRPFLQVPRTLTVQACRDAGLTPWWDPHNDDPRFARVRARAVVELAEQTLGPGVRAALARSAELLRRDAEALDGYAGLALCSLGAPPWPVAGLLAHPAAVRARVWRQALTGAPGGPSLTASHVAALEALLTQWRGQGPVWLPGGVQVRRIAGFLHVDAPGRVE